MRYPFIWLALACPLSALAQQPTLTLERAIATAVRDAPTIAASSAITESARAVAPSAGRLPDPVLAAGVDNLPVESADRFSLTRDFMTMRTVGLMQTFPNRAKRRLEYEQARRNIDVAEGEVRKRRFEVAHAAAGAWIATAVSEEQLSRLRALKPDFDLQAAAARGALSSGRATAADALRAQSLVARLEERILSVQQVSEMHRAELARWIGADAERRLAPIPIEDELEHSLSSLIGGVPAHAPIAPAMARVDAAKTDVALARAQKRPDWSAAFMYGKRGSDFADMVSLEFQVTLPLFPGHRQDPKIAAKLAMVRAQEAERDAEIRMHTAEVRAAVAQWRLGRQRLKSFSADILPLARDRSRAALASYRAGRGSLDGAIDALTEEIDAQIEHVQLLGAVANAWVFLHLLHGSETAP